MPKPRFIWLDDHGTGRNVVALFRRRFRLAAVPKRAVLNLFADTRYRLRVNGEVASYGPARFVPSAPEHDEVDLAPWLVAGWNVIVVEAQHRGEAAFDALPSIGGFIAWGRCGAVDLSTPGAWAMRRGSAWDGGSPVFSFAQGPLEICDLRELPPGLHDPRVDQRGWEPPVAIASQEHWGRLVPRTIPPLSLRLRPPSRAMLVAALRDDEQRIGFREPGPASGRGVRRRTPYAVCLHSPREQEATLGLFWGPHFLNGEELKPTTNGSLGNRQDARVRLRAGWNLLYGEPEVMTTAWLVMIGLPRAAGLEARAMPDLASPDAMLRAGSFPESELPASGKRGAPASFEQLPTLGAPWTPVPRDAVLSVPAREMAWDVPGEHVAHDAARVDGIELPCAPGRAATVVLDLGGEFLGHVALEVDAPAGTRIDVACAERLRDDGALDLFRTNWMVSEAERFVAPGGCARIEAFNPRGGRYVQVTARGADAPVRLARASVRETTYPLREEGTFASGDPLFAWLWRAGVDTLRACMEDAYLDCPWRERGLYLGDALVEWHVTRAVTADWRLVRRCIRLWAQGQRPDGQFQDVVPSYHDTVLEDYSLIWVLLLHDYWAWTGDTGLVRELYSAIPKLFASPSWRFAESGLLDASAMHCFIDWAERKEAKTGECGALNAYWIRALERAAVLAELVGRGADAKDWRRRAAASRRAFASLWDAGARRFAGARVKGALLDGPAPQTNALALCFDLAPKREVPAVLDALEGALDGNPGTGGRLIGPYFLHFALDALYAHGRAAAAERAVRRNYAAMHAAGAWTLWEIFPGDGSLCHAWSAAPLRIFAERVLGVRQIRPGRPDEVLIAPESESLDWAEGVVPHRRGPIRVAWERRGSALALAVDAPRGVRWRAAPAGRLARLRLDLARGH